jgi:hypothetical protein
MNNETLGLVTTIVKCPLFWNFYCAERPKVAELPRTQVSQSRGLFAHENGRLVVESGIAGNSYMGVL